MAERSRDEVRDWSGVEASNTDIDEIREWVVWGVGPRPESLAGARKATDVAEMIVHANDPGWNNEVGERWVLLVHADEDDVDELAQDEPTISGYAAYLAPGKLDDGQGEPMRGVLRGDVGPRRKADQ